MQAFAASLQNELFKLRKRKKYLVLLIIASAICVVSALRVLIVNYLTDGGVSREAILGGLMSSNMPFVLLIFLPLMAIYVYRNGVQGLGFGLLPMMGGVVELFARMIVAKISAHFMSYLGICLASPAAWVSAGIFFLVVYAVVIRKIQRAFPEDGTPHLQNSNEK